MSASLWFWGVVGVDSVYFELGFFFGFGVFFCGDGWGGFLSVMEQMRHRQQICLELSVALWQILREPFSPCSEPPVAE